MRCGILLTNNVPPQAMIREELAEHEFVFLDGGFAMQPDNGKVTYTAAWRFMQLDTHFRQMQQRVVMT